MSTPDTNRAAFEAWAKDFGYKFDLFGSTLAYKNTSTNHAWSAWQAATEAAKATGTAELPQLPWGDNLNREIEDWLEVRTDKEIHQFIKEYGQRCAEAARQPAPVSVSDEEILMMASQHGVESREFSDECVISLVRAIIAATTRSQP